jgi:hypothetical protein
MWIKSPPRCFARSIRLARILSIVIVATALLFALGYFFRDYELMSFSWL